MTLTFSRSGFDGAYTLKLHRYPSSISSPIVATIIKSVVGFTGEIEFDRTKPDGTPRKLLSSDKLQNLGWQASVDLKTGIEDTYQWFLKNEVQSNNTKIA